MDVECRYLDFKDLENQDGTSCGIGEKPVGYCLDADELSCMYCLMEKYIHGNLYPVEIPYGTYLSNVNVFVEYCLCGKSWSEKCEFRTNVRFKYCYGIPVFKGPVGPSGDPVSNDLPSLGFP